MIWFIEKLRIKAKKVSRTSQQSISETQNTDHEKEIPKERYISLKKAENYWWFEINIII